MMQRRWARIVEVTIAACTVIAVLGFAISKLSQPLEVNEPISWNTNTSFLTVWEPAPQERAGAGTIQLPSTLSNKQRNNALMVRAFRTAIGDSWKSTVRILNDGRQVALGAVVDKGGFVISKASELPEGDFDCRTWDNKIVRGRVKATDANLDLALIQVDREDLPVVKWAVDTVLVAGAWVGTTDARETPQAIGVVSVPSRPVAPERAILGVQLAPADTGAAVVSVVPGSGAERAGLEVDDVIYAVNGKELASRREVLDTIAQYRAGQRLKLSVRRGEKELTMVARLMDLTSSVLDPTEMEVNGQISARSSGFAKVIQHDTVLTPNQCGGPLVSLKGEVVGVNIARANRVSSYALPTDIIRETVQRLKQSIPSGS
ncbi:MAG: PDZ domain-containing protein [Planctomycetaceae bacterium]|nr:PDZ domain-containing protein [Planctomycetaceae bacterium]